MRISALHVDGFGVWHDLRLANLSPEITVFFGPNEAGKTTLMQFIRTMLYGVSEERRKRYLPPREGGKPGGRMGMLVDGDSFDVTRYAQRDKHDRGRVSIYRPDGEAEGDRVLRDALEGVDEPTFTNVFAVGLDEIQTLGTLSGADVAKAIYRLTSGLDRVSLYDLIQDLGGARARLLDAADAPSVLGELAARRDALMRDISELSSQGRRWSKIAVELEELAAQIDQARSRQKEAERAARRVEVAIGLKPLWAQRAKLDDRLLGYANLFALPSGAIDELDAVNDQIEEHRRQRDILRGQRKQLREEIDELDVNQTLVNNQHRLDALAEQQEWIEALERESADGDQALEELNHRVESETARLAAMWSHDPEHAPDLTREMVEQLEPQAEAIAAAERAVDRAREDLEAKRGSERQYRAKIETAKAAGDRLGLPSDVKEAGELVAHLRRRVNVEQRAEQARREALELEQRNHDLQDRQVMPLETFLLLGCAFLAGPLAAVWWWFYPETSFGGLGGWGVVIGFATSMLAWVVKYFMEDRAADQLDACERQMDQLERQIKETKREARALDAERKVPEGSASLQLQNAERHLAELEHTLPIETQRRRADQEVAEAEAELATAKEQLQRAVGRWKADLEAIGLPDTVRPADLDVMAGQYEQLAELQLKAQNRQHDVDRRQREYHKVAQRITTLAEEADLVVEEASPLEQLEALLSERNLQQSRIDHREKLLGRRRALKEKEARHGEQIEQLQRRRETTFRSAGCADEEAYCQLAADLAKAAELRAERERATREIAAAIGRLGTEDDFAPMLAPDAVGKLDDQWERLTAEHDAFEAELRDLLARRGSLAEQQKALAEDTSLADKRMLLDQTEAQLAEAKERWRERAVIGQMLELIRSDYEANRQPETLLEASRYLHQLTGGRYERVWTPLANDILLVDNRDGQSLGVEALSRGAREQLFLSIRLALVAMYARRGVQLPMVLDDVLVNFDAARARTAAQVLCDFAKDGHQLFVFTCHEHVWDMFKDLHADARRLPDREAGQLESTPDLPAPAPEPEPAETQGAAQPPPAVEAAPPAPAAPELEAIYLDVEPRPHTPLEADYEDVPPRAAPPIEDLLEHTTGDASERDGVEYEFEYEYDQRSPAKFDEAVGDEPQWLPEPIVHAIARR